MERSKYGEYFEKHALETVAKCKFCSASVTTSRASGTSGLRRHLQRHHPNEFSEMLLTERKIENGSRKRESSSAANEEDLTKQIKLIENVVMNWNQLRAEENEESKDELGILASSAMETEETEASGEAFLPRTSSTELNVIANVQSCSKDICRESLHHLQMDLLQKISRLKEAEARASNLNDLLILSQTEATEVETMTRILKAELTSRDMLVMRLRQELKEKNNVIEEERKQNQSLLEKWKNASAEKDEKMKEHMTNMLNQKDALNSEVNAHYTECMTTRLENSRRIGELEAQVKQLKQKKKETTGEDQRVQVKEELRE